MKSLFQFSFKVDNPFLKYAEQLTFASRVVYWQAGWEVFNDYPWLGVGLGNSGFFFPEKMSGFGWGLVEVRRLNVRRNCAAEYQESGGCACWQKTGFDWFLPFFVCWLYPGLAYFFLARKKGC